MALPSFESTPANGRARAGVGRGALGWAALGLLLVHDRVAGKEHVNLAVHQIAQPKNHL